MKKKKDLTVLAVSVLMFCISVFGNSFSLDRKQLKEAQTTASLESAQGLIKKYEKAAKADHVFYLGIVYHNIASTGKKGFTKKALETTKAAKEKTGHPLAAGYYGSALTLKAGEQANSGDLMGAMNNLQKGLAEIDKAVKTAPSDMDLRLLRLENSIGVSLGSPLDRTPQIKEDLGTLSKNIKTLSPDQRSLYHLCAALEAKRKMKPTDALVHLENAIKAAPKSPYAARAKKLLQKLED